MKICVWAYLNKFSSIFLSFFNEKKILGQGVGAMVSVGTLIRPFFWPCTMDFFVIIMVMNSI